MAVGSAAGQFADDVADEVFGVTEEHQIIVEVVQRIIDAGKSSRHAALNHHYRARFVYIENWHAVNWAARVAACRRIGHIIRADQGSAGGG